MKTKGLADQLGDRLSQPEMDDFCSSVEVGDDVRARDILRLHFRDKKVIERLIEFTRQRIKNDRAAYPQLVSLSDVFQQVMKACPGELNDLDALYEFLLQPGAPKPLGRHDRTGLIWQRNELLAWLERKAADRA